MILWVAAAFAAGGATLAAVSPARDGHATVEVVVSDPALAAEILADPSSLRAVVGLGRADVASVRAASAGATVLAFDQSKSFAKHHEAAVAGARSLVASLPDGPVGVAAFGTRLDHVGTADDPAGIPDVLAALHPPGQGATRLKAGITDAIRWAAELAPGDGALRQVVVFTDVGEESREFSNAEVIAAARAAGVRVTIVAFPASGAGLAERLDEAQRLAEATGGSLIQARGTVPATVRDATSGTGVLVVDLAFCGVPEGPGYADDHLAIEIVRDGARVAATPEVPLSQQVTGASTRRCKGTAPVAADPASEPDRPLPEEVVDLAWLGVLGAMGLVLAVLAVGAVLIATRRRPAAFVEAAPEPAPALPPPEPVPPVDVAAAADLPEARLRVARGLPDGVLRVGAKQVVIGASPAADLRMDLPQISGRHALLELFRGGALWITDLGSTNGTVVNGRQLAANERIPLRDGDRVELGRTVELVVELPGGGPAPVRRSVGTVVEPVTSPRRDP